jgi:hypothetical protein
MWPNARISVMGGRRPRPCCPPVKQEQLARAGKPPMTEARSRVRAADLEKYETEGSPYYSTARLWDDGVSIRGDARRSRSRSPRPSTRDPGRRMFASSGCDHASSRSLLALLHASLPPNSPSVRVLDEQKARVTISGSGECRRRVLGTVRVKVRRDAAVRGTVTRSGASWSLPIEVRLPRSRLTGRSGSADTFACKLEGRVGGVAREWSEVGNWKEVDVTRGRRQGEFLSCATSASRR